ncbi:hypothetical protein [Faecalicoccus pleomorphus]|uniref:hypothetical protein n=1 Tax=Faecalicoccus pleomorphus TaxID=1323 RepID=UPI0039F4EDA9
MKKRNISDQCLETHIMINRELRSFNEECLRLIEHIRHVIALYDFLPLKSKNKNDEYLISEKYLKRILDLDDELEGKFYQDSKELIDFSKAIQ